MADYELIGLNEAVPDLRAPTSADRGVIVGGVLAQGLAELDGGADINGSRVATVADTNPLAQAVRVAMTAASGSNGIQALDNANLRFGLGDFTLHWDGVTSGTTANAHLISKIGTYSYELLQTPTGFLRLSILGSLSGGVAANIESTVVNTKADAKFTVTYTRGSPNDTVAFYVDGVQLGAAVTTPTKGLIDPETALNISGRSSGLRENTQTRQAIIYNRALSAAEVLSLCVSGPALADIGASQVNLFTGQTPSITDSGGSAGLMTLARAQCLTLGRALTTAILDLRLRLEWLSASLPSLTQLEQALQDLLHKLLTTQQQGCFPLKLRQRQQTFTF
jgi:hypothetical protein